MLNYLLKYCQLLCRKKSKLLSVFTILLLGSCSSTPPVKTIEGLPVWFHVDEKYSFKGQEGETIVHPFYDLFPFLSVKNSTVNFVPVNTAETEFKYGMNLVSGRRVRLFQYCARPDLNKKYGGVLEYPFFTVGFIPRVLDNLGRPQRVVVFGRQDYYEGLQDPLHNSHRVRVVGGILVRRCYHSYCPPKNWRRSILLIAVDPKDSDFVNITNFNKMRSMVKWKKFLAFLRNDRGGGKSHQMPRVKVEISNQYLPGKLAMKMAVKSGHYFKFKELDELRRGCHKLYDHIWSQYQGLKKHKARIKKKSLEYQKLTKKLTTFNRNVVGHRQRKAKEKYFKELRQLEKDRNFATFFRDFQKKYIRRFYTCSKLVRSTNINHNRKRHWFFAFLEGASHLNHLGHIYDCTRRTWIKNPVVGDTGKQRFDPNKEYKKCSEQSLDGAMRVALSRFEALARENRPFFRYIDYDSGYGGSHHKIYSWAYHPESVKVCKISKGSGQQKKKTYLDRIFPEDVDWSSVNLGTTTYKNDLLAR